VCPYDSATCGERICRDFNLFQIELQIFEITSRPFKSNHFYIKLNSQMCSYRDLNFTHDRDLPITVGTPALGGWLITFDTRRMNWGGSTHLCKPVFAVSSVTVSIRGVTLQNSDGTLRTKETLCAL